MANFEDLKEIRQEEPEKEKVENTLTKTLPEKLGNKGWKIFFACFAVLFLVGWELTREFTYLSAKITTVPFYVSAPLGTKGTVEVQGNYLTKAINSDDKFTSPFVTYITCVPSQRECKEIYMQDFLGELILNDRYWVITKIDKNNIFAIRETKAMNFTLTINVETQEAFVTQQAKNAKTGNPFKDIGTTSAVSTVAPDYKFEYEVRKHYLDFWNTPLLYLFKWI